MESGGQNEDATLLARYVTDGDEGAFARLVNRHAQMLSSTATRICGPDDAPDAVQATLITFAKKAAQIRKRASVGAWLHRAVTLEAMAHRRRRLKRSSQLSATLMEVSTHNSSSGHLAQELDASLNDLSEKDRDVIVLHHLEGLNFRSISQQLGGTEAAWQKRCSRAMEKLARKLSKRGVTASLTALTALFTTARSEAALSQPVLQNLIANAVSQKGAVVGATATANYFLTIMNMKVATVLALSAGFTISSTWQGTRNSPVNKSQDRWENRASLSHEATSTKGRQERGFDLGAFLQALEEYDGLEEDDLATESRLRAAIFHISAGDLTTVMEALDELNHRERFKNIIIAYYARWTELEPEEAWVAMDAVSSFGTGIRRAVVQTWVHLDPETAVAKLAESKRSELLGHLQSYSRMMSQVDPLKIVELVDRLREIWPEAERRLMPQAARVWAHDDPAAAREWVMLEEDSGVRNKALRNISIPAARRHGREGLLFAAEIDDPKMRASTRTKALKWWGWASSGMGLRPDNSVPSLELKQGVPEDWSEKDLQVFSEALMQNFARDHEALLAVARNEQEREIMRRGIIQGASTSNPIYGIGAVLDVSDDFVQSDEGKKTLSTFIHRLNEKNPDAAQELLSKEPDSLHVRTMRAALSTNE